MSDSFLNVVDHRIAHDGRVFLSDADRDILRTICRDPAFIEAVEAVAAAAIMPLENFSKKDIQRELRPALNAAKKLRDTVLQPGKALHYARHSALLESLPGFIADLEQRLLALEERPKTSDRKARAAAKQVAELFRQYRLNPTATADGDFDKTVQIVFSAGNRAKRHTLPRSTHDSILAALK